MNSFQEMNAFFGVPATSRTLEIQRKTAVLRHIDQYYSKLLVLLLSQLQTVSHSKDVRLRDERELRHTQQMSLLAHKDVLSTLPPEAAARLVNANYTLCMYPLFSSYSSEFYGCPESIECFAKLAMGKKIL
ncbi:hypothetical protein APICC_09037 [Apis cerana cerana]|uniref:Uncharacterized protein n=1 Tax=Apis cerana cerana TaxID=94128 RepID=A0A2A3EL47_APICC|nr:hypothetical protein APICC_09037 [Apis cerana cerana]